MTNKKDNIIEEAVKDFQDMVKEIGTKKMKGDLPDYSDVERYYTDWLKQKLSEIWDTAKEAERPSEQTVQIAITAIREWRDSTEENEQGKHSSPRFFSDTEEALEELDEILQAIKQEKDE